MSPTLGKVGGEFSVRTCIYVCIVCDFVCSIKLRMNFNFLLTMPHMGDWGKQERGTELNELLRLKRREKQDCLRLSFV